MFFQNLCRAEFAWRSAESHFRCEEGKLTFLYLNKKVTPEGCHKMQDTRRLRVLLGLDPGPKQHHSSGACPESRFRSKPCILTVDNDPFIKKINLHHAIPSGVLCGANWVTYPANFRRVETPSSTKWCSCRGPAAKHGDSKRDNRDTLLIRKCPTP